MDMAEVRSKREDTLCNILFGLSCKDCPFITCNNHPQFYLALQCVIRQHEAGPKVVEARK